MTNVFLLMMHVSTIRTQITHLYKLSPYPMYYWLCMIYIFRSRLWFVFDWPQIASLSRSYKSKSCCDFILKSNSSNVVTLFENYSKCRIWALVFSTNFCLIKADLSGNTVWPQVSGFQKLAKLTIYCLSNKLLSTQNVNVARFARNVEWDFFCDFQTQWSYHFVIFRYIL